MEEGSLGFIAIVVIDSWHLANNKHFGDIVWNYKSTPIIFPTRMEAIQNAFDVLKTTYNNVEPVSKHGLKDNYDNELTCFGREFHIISFALRNKK